MNEKQPQDTKPEGVTGETPDAFVKKWSWGGFMVEPILILASRRYWYLLLYLLEFIPFLNLIAIPAIKIYFGIRGREFVKAGRGFDSEQEYRGFMKGVDHAGKIFFFIALALFILAIIVVVVVGVNLDSLNPYDTFDSDAEFEQLFNEMETGELPGETPSNDF